MMAALAKVYVLKTDGTWGRKGRNTVTPPVSPTNLTSTAGDGQVALSWTASSTPGVTYQVKRVNIDTVVWSGSGLSTTITGLTNDVTYNFQVYAIDAAGQLSSPSNKTTAVPKPAGGTTPIGTYFGMNWNNKDTFNQTIAGRKAWFSNRVPVSRVYGGTMDGTFPVSASTFPEGRVAWSFKAGGKWTAAQLGNGAAQTDMRNTLLDVPNNTILFITYHHEPNSSGGLEVNATDFVNTYKQLMLAKQAVAATLASRNVTVYITVNFMAYKVASGTVKGQVTPTWNDAWVPATTDCDLLTWDIYGNPGVNTAPSGSNKYGGPATGIEYGTTYPLATIRTQPMWECTQRCGYAEKWGILEFNSPTRSWDASEAGRVLWHQDMMSIFMAPPMSGSVPPKILMLWEAPSGVNWDQSYGRLNGNPTPMVNFWSPYITGVPVTG